MRGIFLNASLRLVRKLAMSVLFKVIAMLPMMSARFNFSVPDSGHTLANEFQAF